MLRSAHAFSVVPQSWRLCWQNHRDTGWRVPSLTIPVAVQVAQVDHGQRALAGGAANAAVAQHAHGVAPIKAGPADMAHKACGCPQHGASTGCRAVETKECIPGSHLTLARHHDPIAACRSSATMVKSRGAAHVGGRKLLLCMSGRLGSSEAHPSSC